MRALLIRYFSLNHAVVSPLLKLWQTDIMIAIDLMVASVAQGTYEQLLECRPSFRRMARAV
jgi:hypothetical protein